MNIRLRIKRINNYLLENSDKNNIKGLLIELEKILQIYKLEKDDK